MDNQGKKFVYNQPHSTVEQSMESPKIESLTFVQRWMLAIRPKTLTAAVAPVFLGWGIAASTGSYSWGPALAALVSALMIQIGTTDCPHGARLRSKLGMSRLSSKRAHFSV